jgi:hypothetical protein
MRIIRAVIISIDSHPTTKFEVFERLNSGSISLNAQELRNSMFRGALNTELRAWVKKPLMRRLIGTKEPRSRMVDEELILRFLALESAFLDYRPSLKRFLNNFLNSHRKVSPSVIADLEGTFDRALTNLSIIFSGPAFRLTDAQGIPTERAVNRALFDTQMLVSSWIDDPQLGRKVASIRLALSKLYLDEVFLDAIQRATGDRTRTRTRVRMLAKCLSEAGVVLNIPFPLP